MLIRHGISTANEYHSLPGNTWGSPTFRDDPNLVDAPLSENGELQTEERLNKQLLYDETFRSFLTGTGSDRNKDDSNDNINSQEEKGVELILVSPLTRCLQTYVYGVEPVLSKLQDATAKQSQGLDTKHISVPVLATPLLRERVWAASDIGRPISVVESEFPSVDFCECHTPPTTDDHWWYTGSDHYQEWRPHGEDQWYAVPGEPQDVFENRMEQLKEWLHRRSETKIVIITHWSVLKYFLGGEELENSQAQIIELPPP